MLSACGAHAAERQLPAGPNRDLVYGACRTCHDLRYLKNSAGIPRRLEELLDSMRQYGLRIPPGERGKILDYLATYLGPTPPPAVETKKAPASGADGAKLFPSNVRPVISRTERAPRARSRRLPATAT